MFPGVAPQWGAILRATGHERYERSLRNVRRRRAASAALLTGVAVTVYRLRRRNVTLRRAEKVLTLPHLAAGRDEKVYRQEAAYLKDGMR